MNSYVQMTCYDHGGVEEDDSSILTASVPTAETANFISPTVHIRTFPVAEGGGTGSGVLSGWARIRNGWRSHTALERSLLLVTCGLVMMMALILPVLLSAYVNLKSKQDLRLLHITHRSGTSNSLGSFHQFLCVHISTSNHISHIFFFFQRVRHSLINALGTVPDRNKQKKIDCQ